MFLYNQYFKVTKELIRENFLYREITANKYKRYNKIRISSFCNPQNNGSRQWLATAAIVRQNSKKKKKKVKN